jgi:DNA invertase Pin-like site-specific DNA recombinase
LNLEWVSRSQNIRHAYENGLLKHVGLRGEKSPKTTLTEDQVREMRALYEERELTQPELAAMFKVSTSTVYNILHRISWSHI